MSKGSSSVFHRANNPKSTDSGEAGRLPWSPLAAVIVLVAVYFLATLIGVAAMYAFGYVRGWNSAQISKWAEDSSFAQFASMFLVYMAMAFMVYRFVRSKKVSLRALGFVKPRIKDVGIALLAAPVYIFGYGVLLAVMTALFPSINVDQEQQLGFSAAQDHIGLVLTFVSLVLLPPLVEEFLMRGFLFTTFLKRYGFAVAAIVTSIVFAVAHLQAGSGAPLLWVAAIDTFMLSLVLCYMRSKTGSLWPGISLHMIKNLVAFLALFVFHIK